MLSLGVLLFKSVVIRFELQKVNLPFPRLSARGSYAPRKSAFQLKGRKQLLSDLPLNIADRLFSERILKLGAKVVKTERLP